MQKIAVYGSLKRGFYNHDRFSMGELVGVGRILGAMYLNYSYPHLFRPEVSDPHLVREHEVEIYEVDDTTYAWITGMELGAGYQEYKTVVRDSNDIDHAVTVYYTRDDATQYKNQWIAEYSAETAPMAVSV